MHLLCFFLLLILLQCVTLIILLIQKREFLTMTRFFDFLFYAVSGFFLLIAAELFITQMGDAGMIAGLASIVTAILMFCAAVYAFVRD